MVMKTKKKKRSKGMRGSTSYGHGSRKKWKGSGGHGGCGMAGSGKRADHKITLITAMYGNTYFGKQGVTSRGTKKRKRKEINIREILEKFPGKKEVELKEHRVLGDGEIKIALTIKAESFTNSAKQKIEKAGGKAIASEEKFEKKVEKKVEPKVEKKTDKKEVAKVVEENEKTEEIEEEEDEEESEE
jgi:large subunit ribosomal protein L15